MITWTETGREELEQHVAKVRTRMVAVGADADEVAADLERHVEAELTEARVSVATREDVRRVLTRMGAVEAGLMEAGEREGFSGVGFRGMGARPKSWFSGVVTWCCILFGVVLPVVTVGFEFFTRACSSEMFDPMPTVFHAAMILLVPLANGLALHRAAKRVKGEDRGPSPRWLGALNGAAVMVAGVYALMFALLTPIAVLAIIVYGLGLLPLAPFLGFVTALICRGRLRKQADGSKSPLAGWRVGAAVALVILLGLETPSLLTEIGVSMVRSENPETVQRGLGLLRAVPSEERLFQSCYAMGASPDLVSFAFRLAGEGGGNFGVRRGDGSEADARKLYYRVTGKPFNLEAAPKRFRFGASSMSDDWVWDVDRGGEIVGQRLKGLTLAESRIDGTIDANALTGYVEWTMVFKNAARNNQEARAQIALPPGGVVSRLTLWVNGEEREAAFAGRAQVREAYQQVAIRQNRDPVLITTKGAGRVQMQCFPVPAGGEMKIRFGVTMPLRPLADGKAEAKLPQIIEQNFSVPQDVAHTVWLESASALSVDGSALRAQRESSGVWSAHGPLLLKNGEAFPLATVTGDVDRRERWAVHPQMSGNVFVQNLVEAGRHAPGELVIVVDGSKSMEPSIREIAEAIAAQDPAAKITLLVAGDVVMTCPVRVPAEVAAWLRARTFVGGQDNLDALSAAWDEAAGAGGQVFWIHGAQPCGWQSFEGLSQKQTRRPKQVAIRAFAAVQGAQVILEKLDGVPRVSAAGRWRTLREDLSEELGRALTGGGKNLERTVEARAQESFAADRQEKGAHIARLWAAEEVVRLMESSPQKRSEAVALAGKFQLVTSVSGAVVLETKAQFDAAGLAAIDPTTAPNIPEPATVVLIMSGAAAVFVVWRRRKMGRRDGVAERALSSIR